MGTKRCARKKDQLNPRREEQIQSGAEERKESRCFIEKLKMSSLVVVGRRSHLSRAYFSFWDIDTTQRLSSNSLCSADVLQWLCNETHLSPVSINDYEPKHYSKLNIFCILFTLFKAYFVTAARPKFYWRRSISTLDDRKTSVMTSTMNQFVLEFEVVQQPIFFQNKQFFIFQHLPFKILCAFCDWKCTLALKMFIIL